MRTRPLMLLVPAILGLLHPAIEINIPPGQSGVAASGRASAPRIGALEATVPFAAPEGFACASEPTNQPIQYGDLVTCDLSLGDTDQFGFIAEAGDSVVIQVTAISGGVPCVELFDPFASNTNTACGTLPIGRTARINTMLGNPGNHTIRVREVNGTAEMDYVLVLDRTGPFSSPGATPIQPSQNIPGLIDPPGDFDPYFFFGMAGDTVTVRMSDGADPVPCVELFDPLGSQLARDCGTHPIGDVATVDITLGTTGFHTIMANEDISAFFVGPMDYTVDYQCLGQCPPTPPAARPFFKIFIGEPVVHATITAAPPQMWTLGAAKVAPPNPDRLPVTRFQRP